MFSAFPCGRTQHVRCMHSGIVSMIPHSRLIKLAIVIIFQVISVLPFSEKNAFVTEYLLESSLAQFKNVVCCFQTISCLNKSICSAACLFSPL